MRDVLDNISLAEKNKCYAISFTRMEVVVALFSVLSGMSEETVILQEESVEWKSEIYSILGERLFSFTISKLVNSL